MAAEQVISDFKASRGWLVRFLRRFHFTIHQKSMTGQTLPKDCFVKVANFVNFCKTLHDCYSFPLCNIANMDKTPIWADMPSETTIDLKVKKNDTN